MALSLRVRFTCVWCLAFSCNVFAADKTLLVTCLPDTPIVRPGDEVNLKLWAILSDGQALPGEAKVEWNTKDGVLKSQQMPASTAPDEQRVGDLRAHRIAAWQFDSAQPEGEYAAQAIVTLLNLEPGNCTVRVRVSKHSDQQADPKTRQANLRNLFLIGDEKGSPYYGLSLYFLLPEQNPNPTTGARYSSFVTALLEVASGVAELREHRNPHDYVVPYLLMRTRPDKNADLKSLTPWVLEKYNYRRARRLLEQQNLTYKSGPAIVFSDGRSPIDLTGWPLDSIGSAVSLALGIAMQVDQSDLNESRFRLREAFFIFASLFVGRAEAERLRDGSNH